MRASGNHRYQVGQRLTYTGPGGRYVYPVTVEELCEAAYSEPLYMVRGADHPKAWTAAESRLREIAEDKAGV